MMKWVYLAATAVVGMVCAFTNQQHTTATLSDVSAHQQPSPAKDAQIKRGEYLVMIMGCGDCHSPKTMTPQGPAPDMSRFLSGYNSIRPLGEFDKSIAKTGQWVLFNGDNTAAVGPWGVSFAANLTPDATGIGNWSYEQFSKALRQGKSKGLDNTRPLLPPMPWPNYINMADTDMRAVFAYLKSLKPVANAVPAPMPPAP